jgi:NAD(P)-dependent dehydrogenase (short-subunit alcohol dehydrogenase family)
MIIVTGASKGVGRATVLSLLRDHGCNVLAVSRDGTALNGLAVEAGGLRGSMVTLPLDITTTEAPARILQAVGGERVMGLVNNAGVLVKRPLGEWGQADLELLFRTNVHAPLRLCQILADRLDGTPPGHVVNIGSMGGFQGSVKFTGLAAYSASKAALANLSECLAEEWKERGIRCNCLALGSVDTEMLQVAFPAYRAPTTAEEMGAFIARFVLEGHRQFNGKVLPVAVTTP